MPHELTNQAVSDWLLKQLLSIDLNLTIRIIPKDYCILSLN